MLFAGSVFFLTMRHDRDEAHLFGAKNKRGQELFKVYKRNFVLEIQTLKELKVRCYTLFVECK